MPTKSPFPDIQIPNVDLWGLMFEEPRDFANSQVIYRTVDSSRHYTWQQVKEAAKGFGEGLRNLWDWQKGDVLNIFASNDVDYGAIVYGTFYAGGIVSPANPGYSAEELSFQLSNSGSKAIVTTIESLPIACKAARQCNIPEERIILLGAGRDPTHRFKHWTSIRKTSGSTRYLRRKMDPDKDLAFLVYSSGTTGLPKGVMLSHRNVVSDLLMIRGAVGGKWYSSGQDKILGVLPFFHIYGLVGLVQQSLHRGIEMVVMPAFDLKVFLQAIQDHKITFIYVAPPIIVRLARDKVVDNYDLSSIRMITSGAAPLTRELVDAVHKRLGIKINQAYGLSETSPMTHTQPWDEWYTSVGSVGKMFPNITAKYMSPDGKELGPGETGELYLSGPNVFKGYWKNEVATKEAITDDGYFKTGDVGYQDENHNFYITDRVKELIKYKGFQVAPAELEGKLLDHPAINDVAVIGVYDEVQHTEVPRAYVVTATATTSGSGSGADSLADEIVNWLSGKVANHKKLRGGVRFVDEIPKSAAGKILRRVLKDKAKQEDAAKGGKAKL
ncbi:putative 4-coumarate-CoA ligase 1 [Exophiala dermatitidis]|uniref:4-coumarate-CoA ligase n=1 Tax=Exophiala dermatitidis (strain ATCC 34100 / CBS 525.76 / NIH/UT8656) TaxID=858893 RepID=H6C306_EXODN|nr:4-coumarate-CoA ligase [Exophiala dermatitidis NIH/UT8656]EHY58021.1 4-coumarate-CoA ligase [Exophiala dermatitidis NIH/UT8656]